MSLCVESPDSKERCPVSKHTLYFKTWEKILLTVLSPPNPTTAPLWCSRGIVNNLLQATWLCHTHIKKVTREPLVALAIATFGKEAIELREIPSLLFQLDLRRDRMLSRQRLLAISANSNEIETYILLPKPEQQAVLDGKIQSSKFRFFLSHFHDFTQT